MQRLQAKWVSLCDLMPRKMRTELSHEEVGASSLQLCKVFCLPDAFHRDLAPAPQAMPYI